MVQVVRNFCNEDSFIVGAVKDETALYRLLLRRPSHPSQQTTPLGVCDRSLDLSSEHS